MEETVGALWDRLVKRLAAPGHAAHAVELEQVAQRMAVAFRAFGGDPALRVAPAVHVRHGAHRRLLARIAGTDEMHTPAVRTRETLRLPARVAAFASSELNRELYLWLVAFAAEARPAAGGEHALAAHQATTLRVLARWPGLASLHARLATAHVATRGAIESLPVAERALEAAVRTALLAPGSVAAFPPSPRPFAPVPLWVECPREAAAGDARTGGPADAPPPPAANGGTADANEPRPREAHAARRVQYTRRTDGLLMRFRAESLLTFGEHVRVNRPEEDDPDPHAADAARDLDELALANGEANTASRVRFDLDLPPASADDLVLGAGIALPEWDERRQLLVPDRVRLVEMAPRGAAPGAMPARLQPLARRLRRQFSALLPARSWNKARPEGTELDVDATVRAATDWARGVAAENVYQSLDRRERDLACLALADLSLSTDAWVSGEARVIDVVRDSLLLLGEALAASGDRFALCGFSSLRRSNVRFSLLKRFDEPFGARERGRVLAIKPGYYTRMGAAIRHATAMLGREPAARRVLFILSDGKPNDLDDYDGRHGIADTRHAILEARQRDVRPFCVTIDREGASYLPHVFGPRGFAVITRPAELPRRIASLYADLTR